MIAPPLRLLFLCTHNRCRSILFEALVHAEGGPKVEKLTKGVDQGLQDLIYQLLDAGLF